MVQGLLSAVDIKFAKNFLILMNSNIVTLLTKFPHYTLS
jgi:hypothetical protein